MLTVFEEGDGKAREAMPAADSVYGLSELRKQSNSPELSLVAEQEVCTLYLLPAHQYTRQEGQ